MLIFTKKNQGEACASLPSAECICRAGAGEVLGRDGDAATVTALKAIQDVESEQKEAARLQEQKIAQKASFNQEYDTGECRR